MSTSFLILHDRDGKYLNVLHCYIVWSDGWKKLQNWKPHLTQEVIDDLAELTRLSTLT